MKKNTNEKSLVKVNENGIFYKIKQFFKNLFHKKEVVNTYIATENITSVRKDEDRRNKFIDKIKKVDDEETLLLKLQRKYRSGKIKEEEMTEKQIKSLCDLYDKQIAKLKKSNKIRKQKILEYRKNMQTDF